MGAALVVVATSAGDVLDAGEGDGVPKSFTAPTLAKMATLPPTAAIKSGRRSRDDRPNVSSAGKARAGVSSESTWCAALSTSGSIEIGLLAWSLDVV